ncbi:HAD family hydrolase [Thiopseudomonas acetoxidans]|uniref:HAD family hydrolase n=1 Tax=Thiopseudomonas acetoxidans TaxID=3041622 RepID=A0ABT7SLI3_9GAMM|nr:HAD family hydrolase [Thiopseudomonas sp. CY1220]MDM7857048.1 HAD family hydrolase [Thiopseudomonas sp. CY1220]NLC10242.1 HAD family hydrolase [Gammaproteobacteria bacterium]
MKDFLQQCQHWVFDMDGTLTLAVHDFEHIRQQLDIPPTADILEHLASLPTAEAQAKHAWLLEHEHELAANSQPAPGAHELVTQLHQEGRQLAILTRNAHSLVEVTLEAIGLKPFFQPQNIYGREQAQPKPSPDGMLKIARNWQVCPSKLIMVGDFHFDLTSAKHAGARSILVNTPTNLWPKLTDLYVPDCFALLKQVKQPTG